jgi:phosphoribosylformylglycinamidine synthase
LALTGGLSRICARWRKCQREIEGSEDGLPPSVDLAAERHHGDFVRGLIGAGQVAACHDISDGGLLVAIAEMAMAGGRGVALDPLPAGTVVHAWLFGEDQARYLIETGDPGAVLASARNMSICAQCVGTVGGGELTVPGAGAISVAELRAAKRGLAAGLHGARLTPDSRKPGIDRWRWTRR